MRSTLSLRSGAVAGSRNLFGILACIAWISAGVSCGMEPPPAPVPQTAPGSGSSATSRPYRGAPPVTVLPLTATDIHTNVIQSCALSIIIIIARAQLISLLILVEKIPTLELNKNNQNKEKFILSIIYVSSIHSCTSSLQKLDRNNFR